MKPLKNVFVTLSNPAVNSIVLLRQKMIQSTPVLPRLGFSLLNDAQFEDYAMFVKSQLTINASSFPDLTPDMSTLSIDLNNFQVAAVSARTGAKTAIATRNDARVKLECTLTYMANSCSEIANGDVTLFELSGFEVRSKPTPSGILPAPSNFELTLGPVEGTLGAKFKRVKNSRVYEIYFGQWNTDPDTWTDHIMTTGSRSAIITDLSSNQRYSARCRAIGAKAIPGEWSAVSTMKTY